MPTRNKGVIFTQGHPLDEYEQFRWPEHAAYPGHGYRVERDQGLIIERDVAVPLRDGTRIFVDLYRPDVTHPVPLLVGWSPYGKHSPQDMSKLPGTGVDMNRLSKHTTWEAPDPVWWGREGYALIIPDPRGTWHSEGDASFWNHDEAQDEYDLIEWAAVQPWCTGKVGLAGVSYLAISQWFVASHRPPHLAAIMPWEGFSDAYRETVFHGGIPERGFISWWQRGVQFSHGKVEDLPATCAAHPLLDAYWISKQVDFSKIEVPAFVVASWSDQGLHTRGTLEAYKGLGSKQKWLEIHGRKKWEYFYSEESLQKQLTFWNHFLKGEKTDLESWPAVRLEIRDRYYVGAFQNEKEWPLARTDYQRLHLDAQSGRMLPVAPQNATTQAYDAATGHAQFDFTFAADANLVGHSKLRLWLEADGADDADLFVSLEKIDAAGQPVGFPFFSLREDGPVALGWLRASHRDLDMRRSTPQQPWHTHEREIRLKPGEIIPLEIEIWPSGTKFHAGETLRLVISGHDRRSYEHLPYNIHPSDRNRGRHVIHTGGAYDSHLLIPVV